MTDRSVTGWFGSPRLKSTSPDSSHATTDPKYSCCLLLPGIPSNASKAPGILESTPMRYPPDTTRWALRTEAPKRYSGMAHIAGQASDHGLGKFAMHRQRGFDPPTR